MTDAREHEDAHRKSPTGIVGFDGVTRGGIPAGRATLLRGGPGCGKTVFALETLANGVTHYQEPGILITFEEGPERIRANAASLGLGIDAMSEDDLFIMDARPAPDLVQSGSVDLGGLLAAISAKASLIGAKRVVFDGLDVVLSLLDTRRAVRREVYVLHEWLLKHRMTALITAKTSDGSSPADNTHSLDFIDFMVDCAVVLSHDAVAGISQRNLRVSKYRGSAFDENVIPFVIGAHGLEVAYYGGQPSEQSLAPVERISSGVERLDTMLGGGYFRSASVLITGAPGTAKTTLCGTFVASACNRDESTLFVTFDSSPEEIVRNLLSVGIELQHHLDRGILKMQAMRGISRSAELHFAQIKDLCEIVEARCLVIDPVSALAKSGNREISHNVAERLVDWAKSRDITVVFSSLLDNASMATENTPLQVSTIADTWLHLSYAVQAGERNRGLSIIKSRGTGHSNQLRELILTDNGVDLADVYSADGEVLMGTMRWAKEQEQKVSQERQSAKLQRQKKQAEFEAESLRTQLEALKHRLDAKLEEVTAFEREDDRQEDVRSATREAIKKKRGADQPGAESGEQS